MKRRTLIQSFVAALIANSVTGIAAITKDDCWKLSFAKALKQQPWLLGYKGSNKAFYETTQMTVEGELPPDLRGTFYRNGPARHEIGDMRYHHWFDGDGMVHAFYIDNGTASHQGRYVNTAKYAAEVEAGTSLEQGFGTDLPFMRPVRSADQINVANINVIKYNGELLALWEGGSAYRLDPETLETLGLKSWSEETDGLPFSAHPRFDQDGTLWNFGYSTNANMLVIYRIKADGQLIQTKAHRLDSVPMVHDFFTTERYLGFVLPPFTYDKSKSGSFLEHFNWNPDDGARIMLVDKNDLSQVQFVEVPAFWVFHFANAFDDKHGNIHFQAPIYDDPGIMTSVFHEVMRGNEVTASQSMNMTGLIDIKGKKMTLEPHRDLKNAEFPRINPNFTGIEYRYSVLMQGSNTKSQLGLNALARLDNKTGTVTKYTYADGTSADEHIFVPKPNSRNEGAGWVLGTTLDYRKGKTSLNIFDAEHIESGPVARLHLDYAIPLGLHGNFSPA